MSWGVGSEIMKLPKLEKALWVMDVQQWPKSHTLTLFSSRAGWRSGGVRGEPFLVEGSECSEENA